MSFKEDWKQGSKMAHFRYMINLFFFLLFGGLGVFLAVRFAQGEIGNRHWEYAFFGLCSVIIMVFFSRLGWKDRII